MRMASLLLNASTRSASAELVKHALNVFDVALRNVSAHFEVIAKDGRTGATHYAQLPREVGQVFHLRRLPLSTLWHASGTACGPAKDITKDLAKDIAARHLWRVRFGRHRTLLPAR
jgi:ribosomal protein S7